MAREVLIAYRMNGHDLSLDHGYPVRAIVPGHYGMASVKWLTRIKAVRKPFRGYWQTSDYGYWRNDDDAGGARSLCAGRDAGEIGDRRAPGVYETIAPNAPYTIAGAAWSGESLVAEIALSTDGGQTWAPGEFIDPAQRHAWRRWKFDWLTPRKPGAMHPPGPRHGRQRVRSTRPGMIRITAAM